MRKPRGILSRSQPGRASKHCVTGALGRNSPSVSARAAPYAMNSAARATRWLQSSDSIVETPGPDLIVRRADPLNCEVRLSRLADGDVTPNDRFYIRNHFPVPKIDPECWRLSVHGHVKEPLDLSLRELKRMSAVTLSVTLE